MTEEAQPNPILLDAMFEGLVETIGKDIQEKINAAQKLMQEAESLADQHGIPFYSAYSGLGQAYVPSSFYTKFKGIDLELAAEITNVGSWDLDNEYSDGWQHSAIC